MVLSRRDKIGLVILIILLIFAMILIDGGISVLNGVPIILEGTTER